MKLRILSWNVRGVNDPVKRKVIKNFIRNHRVDIICLQETKVQEMNTKMVRSLGVGHFLDWTALNADGSAGGILLIWDKRRISFVDSLVGNFLVSCFFRMEEDGFQWVFSWVYGPVEKSLRELFWEELGSIKGLWNEPWCVGGDFNEILSPDERFKGGRISNSMRRFANILNDLELRDLLLQGGPFTWRGGLNGRLKSRLDRFVASSD